MNQVAKIEAATGRTYSLTFANRSAQFLAITPPAADTEWQPLPDILDGITFAARFTGSSKTWGHQRAYLDHVHVARGKVFATDGICLVEYAVGECPDFSLLPVWVAQIQAFGTAPCDLSIDHRLKLRWSNGNVLVTPYQSFPKAIDEFTRILRLHDCNDFVPMDSDWRDEIIGQFSYKLAPATAATGANEGYIHFAPDRIVGGPYDREPSIQLRIITHAQADVTFRQKHLLRVLKIADEFKFAHGEDVSYFLFKAAKLRGVVVLNRPAEPIPVLP